MQHLDQPGGQRQRIALARLFLTQSPILILDEATSALDSETEQQVLQNIQRISQNRTVFLIAHRFAPLKRADLILVLEKGVLAEKKQACLEFAIKQHLFHPHDQRTICPKLKWKT